MIDIRELQNIVRRSQSTIANVYREYAQHIFLNAFYRIKGSERVLFKGGTALRIAYKSPRFSEDLDFSAWNISDHEIEDMLNEVLIDLERRNIACQIDEAKPTSGGYLANLMTQIHEEKVTIAIQISTRKKLSKEYQTLSITNEYLPSYIISVLPLVELAGEKVQAALTRAKPRDFFDIYFLLKEGLLPKAEMGNLPKIRETVTKKKLIFQKELGLFLPLSMRPFLKDFPKPLISEIERFGIEF